MPWPEPSSHDHLAPWNEIDTINDEGEEVIECGCTSCNLRRRQDRQMEEMDDD